MLPLLQPCSLFVYLSACCPLASVDVLGSQVASLGLDEGMPLGEECDCYPSTVSRERSSDGSVRIHTPHEVTAPGREDEG
jgi:hypothetical protein